MALMLAMFQQMRLIRKKNQLTLELAQASSKLDRVTKSIERVQKMYKSRETSLASMAKRLENNASIFFNSQLGLGSNNVNVNMYNFGSNIFNNSIVMNTAQAGLMGSKNNGGLEWSQEQFNAVAQFYQSTNGNPQPLYEGEGENKKIKYDTDGKTPLYCESPVKITANDIANFKQAMQYGNMELENRRGMCQQWTNDYRNNVSVWLEDQQARLEAEQDAALEPLSYEQTMLDLEKTTKETQLSKANEELKSYESLVKQEIQNSTPKFGLG